MDHIQKKENSNFDKVAVRFIAETSSSKRGTCAKCQQYSGKIYFLLPDGTHNGPVLPLHPNCRCHYQYLTAFELKEDPNRPTPHFQRYYPNQKAKIFSPDLKEKNNVLDSRNSVYIANSG